MKILELYAIKDTKANAFMNPIIQRTMGEAIRSVVDESKQPNSMFGKHPEDFNLFKLGTFNQETGLITIEPAPKSIGTVANFSTQQ